MRFRGFEDTIWSCWKKCHPPPSKLCSSNSGSTQGLFVLAQSPRAIIKSTGRYLPRGAWKFPCSTGAELKVPDTAVVRSDSIDKVSPVARTEERNHVGEWVKRRDPGLSEPVSLYLIPSKPSPQPRLCPAPSFSLLNHPPMAITWPHLTSFRAARSQGPRAGVAQGPNEVGSVNVSHSCQGWRKGPHTARLLPPLALGTSPEPRQVLL